MKLDYAVDITATADIRRGGFDFKKGKTRHFAKGKLTPSQLAQIVSVDELSLTVVEEPESKEAPVKELAAKETK